MKKRKPNFRGKVKISGDKVYISSTSFQSFCKCPMRGYYDKFTPDETLPILKDSIPVAALKFGSVVHEVLEGYMSNKEVSFERLWAKYKNMEMKYSYKENNWQNLNEVGPVLIKRIKAICSSNKIKSYKYKDKFAVEVQDIYDCGDNIYLTRTFDVIGEVQGKPSVIDFKTAAKKYSEGVEEEISEQLTAYSLPHSLEGIPQVEQVVFLVGTKAKSPSGQLIEVRRSKERTQQFLDDLHKIAIMVREGNYFRDRSVLNCGTANNQYCQYYSLCYD